MSQSEDTVEFSKKRKINDKEEGQDQVLSFRDSLIRNLRILMTNFL